MGIIIDIKERIKISINLLSEGLYEKESIIGMALLCAIAGESIFLLGPPGTAKSMIGRRLKMIFKDASTFEYLMSRFSTPDEIFGPVSIAKLKDEDSYERMTEGYLPSASIVFLDEIWKAGPAIQNSLLTAVNEHIFYNGNKAINIPMKLLIAASNELPDQESGLDALWDRFLVRMVSDSIVDETQFFKMIRQKAVTKIDIPNDLLISDKVYQKWQSDIEEIEIPDYICDFVSFTRTMLKKEQRSKEKAARLFYISDRRWKKIFQIMKASAFLNGRDRIDYSDCILLIHCIWNDESTIPRIKSIIADSFINIIEKKLDKIKTDLAGKLPEFGICMDSKIEIFRFEVIDDQYYEVEDYCDGRCLICKADYLNVVGKIAVTANIYYDENKDCLIIGVPIQGQMDTNFPTVKKVKISSCLSGIMINGIPYYFKTKDSSDGLEEESRNLNYLLQPYKNLIDNDVIPLYNRVMEELATDENIFVSNEYASEIRNRLKVIDTTIKSFLVKLNSISFL